MLKKLLTLLLSVTLLLSLAVPFSADGTSALTALGQYLTDSNAVPQTGYETVVFAKVGLLKNGDTGFLPTPDTESAESLAELIFALLATGQNPANYQDKNYCLLLAKLQKEDGSFGDSLETAALAASALVAADYEGDNFNETKAADFIMSCKQDDGSFSKSGDTLRETALCVTFLSGCGVQTVVTKNALSAAADYARSLLQTEQKDDPQNLCYAILILTDAEGIAETEKNGYPVAALEKLRKEDGSFGDRALNLLALSALEASRYGASETKALMTNGTFEVKLDWEGLRPILRVLGIIAGLSVIMWVFILTKKKPQTQTLEEFKEEAVRDIPVASEEDLDISKPKDEN